MHYPKRKFPTRLWFIGLLGLLLALPAAATAHPLDEFYQVTYITMAPNRITLRLELYTGILIAPRLVALIDTDQDETISTGEAQAYVDLFLKDITFEIDGQPTPLTATQLQFPTPLDLRAGVGIIRFDLYTDLPVEHRGSHQFFYDNQHQPEMSVYLVNVLADAEHWVEITNQERDMLQASLRLDYTIKPEAPVDFGAVDALAKLDLPGGLSPGQEQLTRYLYDPNLSPFILFIALGLSAILGGLHALTPGHGKTLVAAYLIGSRGTTGHAVALGGIVTFTHTASVIVIGLLALLASQFIVPEVLVPTLEILAGLLVISMGLRLLWTRWQALKGEPDPSHPHHHPHEPDDNHPPHHHHHHYSHYHDDSQSTIQNPKSKIQNRHHHHLPENVKMSDLLTLGISGGLVPCPEALGIMIIAIGFNRILLGLGLIVAFSFGLAAVLILIGILLVRSKSLLDKVSGAAGRWQVFLPLASAVIVTLLGVGIVVKGVLPYLS